MQYDINNIRDLIRNNNIKWNGHATQRMLKRNIARNDVIYTLMNGEVIEEYPNDYPYPSCLVFCMLSNNFPMHVVCSIGQDKLWIITVYRPDIFKWHDDYKTRKDVNE